MEGREQARTKETRNERIETLAYTRDRRRGKVNVRMLDWQEGKLYDQDIGEYRLHHRIDRKK